MHSPINFTFIIPHYNIPELLKRCIDSIPERDDVQIIVVDDCSPASKELVDAINYLSKRSGVEFYKTPQGGSAGRARNIGIEHAIGKWLIFADSDDFFAPELSDAMDTFVNEDVDVVYFNFKGVLSDDITKASNRESEYCSYFKNYESSKNEKDFRFNYITPWGKFIKLQMVLDNNIKFDEIRYANDVMFSVLVGCKAKTILPIDIPLYVLTERPGSLTSGFCQKPGETITRCRVALNAYKTIKNNGFDFDFKYESFIKLLVYNNEIKELRDVYHSISTFGISKMKILSIIMGLGKRHVLTALNLAIRDIFSIS